MAGIITGASGVNREVKKVTAGVAGVNREIKGAWAGNGGVNRKVFSGDKTVGELPVGSVVKIVESGILTPYLVVHQGLPSSIYDLSCDGTWLLRKELLSERQWHSSNVNDYANSTIKTYLDNTFLARFDTNTKNTIKNVKIPYRPGSGSSMGINSGANGLFCKIFLLSGYEIGWTNNDYSYIPPDGVKLTYFEFGTDKTANNKRIAYLGSDITWWIRSPNAYDKTYAGRVLSDGSYQRYGCISSGSVRPALVLPFTCLILNEPDVTGAYTLQL